MHIDAYRYAYNILNILDYNRLLNMLLKCHSIFYSVIISKLK